MGAKTSKLSKDDLTCLKQSTYFDRREIQQWHKGFLRDCPSGQLAREDFVKIYKQFFPFGSPEDFANHLFTVFDKDNNGFIHFEEFITVLSTTSRGTLEEKLSWAFELNVGGMVKDLKSFNFSVYGRWFGYINIILCIALGIANLFHVSGVIAFGIISIIQGLVILFIEIPFC